MINDPRVFGKLVLIVDDEPNIRQTIDDMLRAEGFKTTQAPDGKKAFQEAKRLMPDIIVMDVMMPKWDGYKALSELKKSSSTMDIPVIMLTVKASQENIEQGMQLYADKYISKPFDADNLIEEIKASLMVRRKI